MTHLKDANARLDRLGTRAIFFVIFIPLFAVYLSTANRNLPYHIDTGTNVMTAWSFGNHGNPYVDEIGFGDSSSYRYIGLFVTTSSGRSA